jgi:hypothetical protein
MNDENYTFFHFLGRKPKAGLTIWHKGHMPRAWKLLGHWKLLERSFDNILVSLRIYMVLMLSNCTGERSFSRLKQTKSKTRNAILQDRLNSVTIMAMNPDIVNKIDFSIILAEFAAMKARRKFHLFDFVLEDGFQDTWAYTRKRTSR